MSASVVSVIMSREDSLELATSLLHHPIGRRMVSCRLNSSSEQQLSECGKQGTLELPTAIYYDDRGAATVQNPYVLEGLCNSVRLMPGTGIASGQRVN